MSGSASNVVINPVSVLWRIEARHCYTAVADVADSLDGTYFTVMGTHYVWFDGVAVADPAPGGLIAIPVVYTTNDSAATLAGLVATAIDGVSGFNASAVASVVSIGNDVVGEVTDSADVDTGGAIQIVLKGKNFDLGLLVGDVAPTFSPATFDLQAHNTGVTILAKLNQGIESAEVATEMQETTKSNLKEMYKIWGGVFTPGGGTEVFGAGTGQIGKNMLVEAARLEMIPVNSLGSELSYTYSFMLALPIPDTLTFSGENPRILSATWTGFPNLNLANANTNTVLIGDAGQVGL